MIETITATRAKNEIENLIDAAAESHRPILITSGTNNAVLLSEEDWNALQETVHLLSVAGLRESVAEEMNRPDNEFLSEKEFAIELEREDKN